MDATDIFSNDFVIVESLHHEMVFMMHQPHYPVWTIIAKAHLSRWETLDYTSKLALG